jgi:hypothetical protein
MTTEEMVTRIRSLLDEREAGFWSTGEVLNALNDAQNEVINHCLYLFAERGEEGVLPFLLSNLEKETEFIGVTSDEVVLPDDFSYLLSVKCAPTFGATQKPCIIRSAAKLRYVNESNQFMKGDSKNLFCFVRGGKLNFEIPLVNGSITINFLKKAEQITAEQGSILPEHAMGALIIYATALLLEKDEQYDESGAFFQMFTVKLEKLANI